MLDQEMLKYYLQSIEELMADEERILTYSWLASSLSISINLAKHLLELYVKENSSQNLHVTCYLSGISKDRSSIVMDIVERTNVSAWKKNVSHVFSTHIFSVGKVISGDNNLTVNVPYVTGIFDEYISQKSIITSEHITKNSDADMEMLRENAYKKLAGCVPKQLSNVKAKPQQQPEKVEETHAENAAQKQNKPVRANSITEKKNPIATMFAAQGNQKTSKSHANNSDSAVKSKVKGIQGFFQKQSPQKKVNEVKVEFDKPGLEKGRSPVKEISENTFKGNNYDIESSKKILYKEKSPCNTSVKANGNSVLNPVKKSGKNAKKSKAVKKRKRVICMSDSDSDDPFEDKEDIKEEHISSEDEIIPPTPQAHIVKAALNANPLNPRKKKKIVNKTYTDEDGYLLTKKEIIYESCSDEENKESASYEINCEGSDSVNNKTPNEREKKITNGSLGHSKAKKAMAAVAGKNKQATLTNFFRKA